MGIGESGLDKLIKECYSLLGLISFLTAGPKEVRAWTIVKGTKAPQAAGKIHSLLSTAQWRPARRRALSAARERTTSCRTET